LIALAALAVGLSAIGVLQVVAGWIAVRRFALRAPGQRMTATPEITVLKPLHGDEPLLEEALASICRQDYPGWQVVFGVNDPADTALPMVRRLQARFPDCDIAVVVDPTPHGRNPKVGNLINMLPAAKHDVLVIADSDLHVAPDYLQSLVGALEQPGAGLVTTLYSGLLVPPPQPSPAARERGRIEPPLSRSGGGMGRGPRLPGILGAMQINHYFLPGALLARAMGRQDCLGATMALRRETLERIGGFQALVNHLADDNVLGRLVQRLGLTVRLADTVPATTVPEATFAALWRHELRWARTIRTLVPVQFAASVLQYPLAWAALAILLAWGAVWSVAWFAVVWLIRALAAWGVERMLALAFQSPVWLLPLRELMSVAVAVASYAGRDVDWRGERLQADTPVIAAPREGLNPR
jgi:ceramide glucosyltransferase